TLRHRVEHLADERVGFRDGVVVQRADPGPTRRVHDQISLPDLIVEVRSRATWRSDRCVERTAPRLESGALRIVRVGPLIMEVEEERRRLWSRSVELLDAGPRHLGIGRARPFLEALLDPEPGGVAREER